MLFYHTTIVIALAFLSVGAIIVKNCEKGNAMKENLKPDFYRHLSLSAVGGFFGGYAMICHSDMLASAQTMNLLELEMGLLRGEPRAVIIHIGALFIYVCAVALTVLLPRYYHVNPRHAVPVIDAMAALILGILPDSVYGFLALYPIFFAMAFQWSAFSGARGHNSSSIFSTNNTKQATLAFTEYICRGEREQLSKAVFFTSVLIAFHIGAAISFFSVKGFGIKGAWCNLLLIAISLIAILKEERFEAAQAA